eukprot:TRINITY_DN9785_c0_g1_i3.p1 TRINITY_DN9785_c0_g1~~TRINITY_DN9785_c0_g1_i3.p1  ORF type:complete len:150 (-),score=16.32 TRINITY_DN9785_c0_g1_i3:137-586(-)
MIYTFRNISNAQCIAVPKTVESSANSNDSHAQKHLYNPTKKGPLDNVDPSFELVKPEKIDLELNTLRCSDVKKNGVAGLVEIKSNAKLFPFMQQERNARRETIKLKKNRKESIDGNIVEDAIYDSPRSRYKNNKCNNDKPMACVGCILA